MRRVVASLAKNIMLITCSKPRRSGLHWLSHLLCVFLISKTFTILPNLKINKSWNLHQASTSQDIVLMAPILYIFQISLYDDLLTRLSIAMVLSFKEVLNWPFNFMFCITCITTWWNGWKDHPKLLGSSCKWH